MKTYPINKKKCNQCKKIKSIRLFYRDEQKPDGLMYHCRDCHRKRHIESYGKRKPKIKKYHSEYYQKNAEQERMKSRERYAKAKKSVTEELGGKCVRCGFSDKRVLQVDHIYGGGRKHFKVKGTGYTMYTEMIESIRNGEGKYQLLCANCNLIEAFEKGYKKTIWT